MKMSETWHLQKIKNSSKESTFREQPKQKPNKIMKTAETGLLSLLIRDNEK